MGLGGRSVPMEDSTGVQHHTFPLQKWLMEQEQAFELCLPENQCNHYPQQCKSPPPNLSQGTHPNQEAKIQQGKHQPLLPPQKVDPDIPHPALPHPKKNKASPSAPPTPKKPPSKKPLQAQPSEDSVEGPFQHCLQGPVIVLIGFQNPFCSELQDKALERRARYQLD
uniref:Uncharacterized protein n=1 Tax=Sphaerodactylus townsendi TaxID=933632 RepID=A0ACB8FMA5_9SAUR